MADFPTRLAVSILASMLVAPVFAQNTPAREPLPREELQSLAAVFTMLRQEYVTQTDAPAMIRDAIRGMVRGTDREAGEYFGPAEFREFKEGRAARSDAAIGVEVMRRDTQLVLTTVSGGPAGAAGIRSGDVLHAVDGRRCGELAVNQVLDLLRGPLGSRVALTVFRESSLTVETISVERKAFALARPAVTRPAPGVAMLRIVAFQEATLADAVDALRAAWQAQAFSAVILDLRGNLGGLVETSVGVAAMFLPEGAVVANASGRTPESQQVYRAVKDNYGRRLARDPLADLPSAVRSLPLAVLVDGSTAAGAEIVAAALQEHKRALVLGEQTIGRGSIQTVRPLSPNDGLKYTTAYWTSPGGSRIHGVGVRPDVVMPAMSDQVVDAAVRRLLPG